ncbi:MAG: hypothetical protein QOJ65_818 [Fimbriimonadaceae bacterium]|jgi:predicted acyltransferase|nr:hypothetical protein [Fimbriimonadaceae bacterium]
MAHIAEPYGPPRPVFVSKTAPDQVRFVSIDALKGLAILFLWVVYAFPGTDSLPDQLKPSAWGQVHLVNLLVPAILLALGAGIALSAGFAASNGETFLRFLNRALKRSLCLIFIGILLDSAVELRPVVQVGALQLMGLCYFLTAVFSRTPVWLRAALAEGLLLAYWAWIRLSVVPGGKIGTFNEHTNIVRHMNERVLAPYGLRGLIAVVPVLSVMLTGTMAGSAYWEELPRVKRALAFIGAGAIMVALGWVCTMPWALDMPMVQAYWTSSYALFATGISACVLGLFTLLLDGYGGRIAAFLFLVPASSVVLGIAGPLFLKSMVLQTWRMPGSNESLEGGLVRLSMDQFGPVAGRWVYGAAFVVLWWVILAVVYSRRNRSREES